MSSSRKHRVKKKMRSVSKRRFSKSRLSKGRKISKRLSRRRLKSKLSRKITKVGGRKKKRPTQIRKNINKILRKNRKYLKHRKSRIVQSGGIITIDQIKFNLRQLNSQIQSLYNEHITLGVSEYPVTRYFVEEKDNQPLQVYYEIKRNMKKMNKDDYFKILHQITTTSTEIIEQMEKYIQSLRLILKVTDPLYTFFTPSPSLFEEYIICKKVILRAQYIIPIANHLDIESEIRSIYNERKLDPSIPFIQHFSNPETWNFVTTRQRISGRLTIQTFIRIIGDKIRINKRHIDNSLMINRIDDYRNFMALLMKRFHLSEHSIVFPLNSDIIIPAFHKKGLQKYKNDLQAILLYISKQYDIVISNIKNIERGFKSARERKEQMELPSVPTHPISERNAAQQAREKLQEKAQANTRMITLMKLMDNTMEMKTEYTVEATKSFYLQKFNEIIGKITGKNYKDKFDFSRQNKGQIHTEKGKRTWIKNYREPIKAFKDQRDITNFFELM